MGSPLLIPFPQHTPYTTNRANILQQSTNEEDEDSPFQINLAIPNYASSNRANKKRVVLESTCGTESDKVMQEKIARETALPFIAHETVNQDVQFIQPHYAVVQSPPFMSVHSWVNTPYIRTCPYI